jgi:hypothetical protein
MKIVILHGEIFEFSQCDILPLVSFRFSLNFPEERVVCCFLPCIGWK